MKWTVTSQTVEEIAQKQKQLINGAVPFVKPSGIPAYATCTLLKEENEDVVEEFLYKNKEFEVVNLKSSIEKWGLGEFGGEKCIKILPNKGGMDGFYNILFLKSRLF